MADRPPNLLLGRISGDIPADRDDHSTRPRDLLVRLQWPGEVIPEDSRGVVAEPFQEGSVGAASATEALSAVAAALAMEAASGAIGRNPGQAERR